MNIIDILYGHDGWFTNCPPPDWWEHELSENEAPFPWFGGKRKVRNLVWERFGEVKNYIEPFAGSMAVLLGRPHAPTIETVNDYDRFVANFWRAAKADPDKVAEHADWPVNETDLHARHKYLVKRKAMLRARLLEDPTFYDARIAGWWVWGLCAWIGSGWCQAQELRVDGTPREKIQKLAPQAQNGVHAKRMRLSEQLPNIAGGSGHGNSPQYGNGVHGKTMRSAGQLPHLGGEYTAGQGVHAPSTRSKLVHTLRAIAKRLQYTRITCGDFERILSPAVTWRHGLTGVFLDPPYPSDAGSMGGIYSDEAHERETFARAFRYCLANDDQKDLRIALCYYEGTRVDDSDVSDKLRSLGWEIVAWKAGGGYGGQNMRGNDNAKRERIAFSPHCLRAKQGSLF
jgi:site-specific DNA-adenine methylase